MRFAFIAATVLALGACNMIADAQEGSSSGGEARMDQRSYDVGTFDSVSLGGHHNVVVTVGPAASVRAEGHTAELDRLEIEVRGDTLRIGSKRDGWRMGRSRPVTVHVTTPELRAASLGGSGDMKIDGVEGERFAASIGGSGDIHVGALRVGEARFSVAGSGGIRAAGSASRTKVDIAGSGGINIAGLDAEQATVSIAGSGDVRARATRTAAVSIVGSGDVTMSGGAECSVSKMGSGSVRCGA